MGRRTYEMLAGLPDEARDASWQRMTELDKVVFSRTLKRAEWANTRICDSDLVEEIRRLKSEGDVPLRTMGSLSVGRQLIDAGLVDRVRLMTFPLIAGNEGREAAFADMSSADLELVDHRSLDGRILLVEYRPTGEDIPRAERRRSAQPGDQPGDLVGTTPAQGHAGAAVAVAVDHPALGLQAHLRSHRAQADPVGDHSRRASAGTNREARRRISVAVSGDGVRLQSPSWSVPPTTTVSARGTTYVGPSESSHQRSSSTPSTITT